MSWKRLAFLVALAVVLPCVPRSASALVTGGDDPPGDDGGGDDGGGDWVRARSLLVRDAAASDGDVFGHVEVRTRGTRQRFEVETAGLAPGDAVEVRVEDASAAMVLAGTATADAEGRAELELDTGDGDALPAGAATVAELVGRRVEVRDALGGPLLRGLVPAPGSSGPNLRGRTRLRDDGSGARIEVEMKVRGRDGRQEFRLSVKRAPAGSIVELWIDDGAGTMVKAVASTAGAGGRARLRLDSLRGDGMPLDAPVLEDLAGRPFEVRVGAAVLASGNLPDL